MTAAHPSEEVDAAVARYIERREAIDRGEASWVSLADFYTEDAVFVDAAWGRVEGRAAIAELMVEAMAGLEGFTYPIDVVAIEGDHVLIAWRQVVDGLQLRGGPFQHTGVSIMRYGGDGCFSFEEDLMNVALVGTDLVDAGWEPGPGFTMPPPDVAR